MPPPLLEQEVRHLGVEGVRRVAKLDAARVGSDEDITGQGPLGADDSEVFVIGSQQVYTYEMGLERMRELRIRSLGPVRLTPAGD